MSVVTITGKNTYLASQKLAELKQDFVQIHGESGVRTLSAEEADFNDISEGIFSIGLFSQANLLVLTDISKNKFLQEKLSEKLDQVPSESSLIIYDSQLDRRSTFFKDLKSKTELFDLKELDERALINWTIEEFKTLGGELSYSEASFLVQRVNLDQWMVKNELEKLINLSSKPDKKLIEEVVDESFNETIFRLLDFAFSGQTEKAVTMYRDMLKNQIEPHYILSMLLWQLHIVLVVAWAPHDMTLDEVAKEAKLSPFVVKKSRGLAERRSKAELKNILIAATDTDLALKTGSQSEAETLVELLIVKIAQ